MDFDESFSEMDETRAQYEMEHWTRRLEIKKKYEDSTPFEIDID